MSTTITRERPNSPDARALIEELDAELKPLYPAVSRHGYSVDQLLAEDVAFFIIRLEGIPAGCGGIKLIGSEYAEIKRMYIRPQFRGTGLARHVLTRLTAHALEKNIDLLRLETGIHQHAAIALYERIGFQRIPPFGEYRQDVVSLCYEMRARRSNESQSDQGDIRASTHEVLAGSGRVR